MKASALLQKASELERQGQVAEAIAGYQKVLAREPSNIDALLLLGQAQLRRGNLAASDKALRRAVKLRPQHGAGQMLLGMVSSRRGRPQEALACFARALAADPGSTTALLYQADTLATLGRHAEAVAAFDKALAGDPGNVVAWNNRALALEALGRDREAAQSFERALALRPDLAEIRFSLANALHRLQAYEQAAEHYRQAIAQRPGFAPAHANLGNTLFKLRRWEEALRALNEAVRLQPNEAKLHDAFGLCLRHLQRDQESLGNFERALALAPEDTDILANKAGALFVLGRMDEARSLLERAIALKPGDPMLYRDLSQTRRFSADDPAITAMEGLLPALGPEPPERRMALHFALAKAYDDTGEAERAFPHLVQANALRRRQLDYDESAELTHMQAIADTFTRELMRDKAGLGDPSNRPIFIIGMPRSGTTLVERIVASHPQVFGAGEQKMFGEAVAALVRPGGPDYPAMVPGLTADELRGLAAAYLARMAALVPDGLRFTDKLPANYNHVGLIHLALPQARIINVQRYPLDTCLSIFSIDFNDPPGFAYDLGELGRFYRAYERLMAHWRAVLPQGVMLDVRYEDVVDDIEGAARRMLAHCGLAWDEACLAFHRQAGAVRTASAYQVRQPLYRRALGRWKPYADQLGPLLEALDMTPESAAG